MHIHVIYEAQYLIHRMPNRQMLPKRPGTSEVCCVQYVRLHNREYRNATKMA